MKETSWALAESLPSSLSKQVFFWNVGRKQKILKQACSCGRMVSFMLNVLIENVESLLIAAVQQNTLNVVIRVLQI